MLRAHVDNNDKTAPLRTVAEQRRLTAHEVEIGIPAAATRIAG